VTIDRRNIEYILPLVRKLTKLGICSDLTFIDISHSNYYDFSNIKDNKLLVLPYPSVHRQFNTMYVEHLNIHMGKSFYDKVLNVSGSNMDCELERDFNNLTIDADGSVRLCLRIRGNNTPNNFKVNEIFMENGHLNKDFLNIISQDKEDYCLGCNWTCSIMAKMISDEMESSDNLIHTKKRGD